MDPCDEAGVHQGWLCESRSGPPPLPVQRNRGPRRLAHGAVRSICGRSGDDVSRVDPMKLHSTGEPPSLDSALT